jgi:hypothetical protein
MSTYPFNWQHYCDSVPSHSPTVYGFVGDTGDVNRFGARFRVANSFRGIELEGYSDATALGYSAFCRVLFVWSAFESFLRILGIDQTQSGPLLENHGAAKALANLQTLDVDNRFYDFIYQRVNGRHKTELDTYRNGNPCNVGYLASAIRHIFAHGHLTPNANSVDPGIVISICDKLCGFLLHVMNQEFGDRVATFMASK